MKKIMMALAATSMFAVPASAGHINNGGNIKVGKEPKVCLLTFESAAARTSGADTGVVKAQYVPFSIATKLKKDSSTQAIAYYGDGTLAAMYSGSINFYYPSGSTSTTLGITQTAYTQEICEAYMEYAESRDMEDGDDD